MKKPLLHRLRAFIHIYTNLIPINIREYLPVTLHPTSSISQRKKCMILIFDQLSSLSNKRIQSNVGKFLKCLVLCVISIAKSSIDLSILISYLSRPS